jgi:uncharacterized protein YdaU (DUF1376 family)
LSRKNQWSPWYWDAWDADTKHLSHTQYSIYHRLLAHYYRTQKPLVANASGLARICYAVTTGELEDLALVLLQFFTKEDDGYHSKRADEELEKTCKINKIRQLSGRLGGLAKARNLLEQNPTQYNTYTYTPKEDQNLGAPHPTKNGTRLPVDFSVTPEIKTFALENHLPNPDDEICKFVDYWTGVPGAKGRKLDWQATFRNWLRKAAEIKHANGGNGNGNGSERKTAAQLRNERSAAFIERAFREAGTS